MLAFQLFDFCERGSLSKPQFAESLFSLIGHELYNRNQSFLLFARYDEDRNGVINYRKFCKLVIPTDKSSADRLMNRISTRDRMSFDT